MTEQDYPQYLNRTVEFLDLTGRRHQEKCGFDMVCLSPLRWYSAYQRPQHLMSRFARETRVFFIEEPVFDATLANPGLQVSTPAPGLWVVVPQLPQDLDDETVVFTRKRLLDEFFQTTGIEQFVLWYCTPMALPFSRHLKPLGVIYDCMVSVCGSQGVPPERSEREREMFSRADLVFTDRQSLYDTIRNYHPSVHLFSGSIDVHHFSQARLIEKDPPDQAPIPHPRLGFFGVVDERVNLQLLEETARLRPDWHFVMLGPVVGINPEALPQLENVHYLGGKDYAELPHYLAGWDIAMMPYAWKGSARFVINPIRTLEYLAAGKRIISTPIPDVTRSYGEKGLVKIADTPEDFIRVAELTLAEINHDSSEWRLQVDSLLQQTSWDMTCSKMIVHISQVIGRSKPKQTKKTADLSYVPWRVPNLVYSS